MSLRHQAGEQGTIEPGRAELGRVARQAKQALTIRTNGQGFTDLTQAIREFVVEAEARRGIVHAFCAHTSASLTVQENADPDVRADLLDALDDLAPRGTLYRHDSEGADDMPAHIRSLLTDHSVVVPVEGGKLALGTWQAVYFIEHRDRPHRRTVLLSFLGE